MPQHARRRRLQNLKVNEIALVDAGANPGAKVLLWKRRVEKQRTGVAEGHSHELGEGDTRTSSVDGHSHRYLGGDTTQMTDGHSHSVPPSVRRDRVASSLFGKIRDAVRRVLKDDDRARDYSEVREDQLAFKAMDEIFGRIGALQSSVSDILFTDEEGIDRQKRIAESVKQFRSEMEKDLGDILAGKFQKDDDPPHRRKEDDMPKKVKIDLTKIPEENREAVKLLVERAEKADELEKQFTELAPKMKEGAAKLEELKKEIAVLKGTKDEPDPLKDLPEDARKRVQALEKKSDDQAAELQKRDERIAALEKENRRKVHVAKASTLTHYPKSAEEIAELLMKAEDAGTLEDTWNSLKIADEALAKAKLFEEIGSGATPDGQAAALAKIDQLATELQKADPKLTKEAAVTLALEQNPELYVDYEREKGLPRA